MYLTDLFIRIFWDNRHKSNGWRYSEIKSLFKKSKYFASGKMLFIFKEVVLIILILLDSLIRPTFPHKLIQKLRRIATCAVWSTVQWSPLAAWDLGIAFFSNASNDKPFISLFLSVTVKFVGVRRNCPLVILPRYLFLPRQTLAEMLSFVFDRSGLCKLWSVPDCNLLHTLRGELESCLNLLFPGVTSVKQ